MIDETTRCVIRELLSDDFYGLWEIKWRIVTVRRETAQVFESLRSTMAAMIDAGEIVLLSVDQHPGGEAKALSAENALRVAQDAGNFDAPEFGSPTFEAGLARGDSSLVGRVNDTPDDT